MGEDAPVAYIAGELAEDIDAQKMRHGRGASQALDGELQMIDSSCIRVHQHGVE